MLKKTGFPKLSITSSWDIDARTIEGPWSRICLQILIQKSSCIFFGSIYPDKLEIDWPVNSFWNPWV